MNRQKQLRLLAFLQELAEAEIALDDIKQKLKESPCYCPLSLFAKISKGQDNITIQMMQQYPGKALGFKERQIHQLFCRFDWSRSGRISKQDFVRQLKPFRSKRLKVQNRYKLTNDIENIFLELIKEYIERWRVHEICREELSRLVPYEAFDSIAIFRRGFLGPDQLYFYALKNDVEITRWKAEVMFYALKRRYYKSVSLQAFCENLWPLEFGYYPRFQVELRKMDIQELRIVNEQDRRYAQKSRKQHYKLIRQQMRHENKQTFESLSTLELKGQDTKYPNQNFNQKLKRQKLLTQGARRLSPQKYKVGFTNIVNQAQEELSRRLQRHNDSIRPKTEISEEKYQQRKHNSNIQLLYPSDCKYSLRTPKSHLFSIKPKDTKVNEKRIHLFSISESDSSDSSRLNYSFGAEHLRVYSTSKDDKCSTYNTIDM